MGTQAAHSHPDADERLIRALLWLGWLIPFASAAAFIAIYGVDVPYVDQWGLAWLFTAAADGHGLWLQLRSCINEHPVLFPKLVWLATAFTTKWNTRADMAVNLAVLLVTFIAIERIQTRETWQRVDWTAALATLAVSLLMFSFVNYDTLLFGACLPYIAVDACAVLAIYALVAARDCPILGLAIAWTLCAIASFSSLQGMLAWLVITPCVIASMKSRRSAATAIGATMLLAAAACVLFVLAFVRAAPPTDHFFWCRNPIQALLFFLAVVGAPLAQTPWTEPGPVAILLGFILIASFSAALWMYFVSEQWSKAAPWISIGMFGLGFAAMVALGRSEFGVASGSTSSRYMSSTSLVTIANVGLWRQLLRSTAKAKLKFAAIATAIGAFSVVGSFASLPIARKLWQERTRSGAYLEVIRYIDPATDRNIESVLSPLCPLVEFVPVIRPSMELAAQLGFRKLARHVPFIQNRSATYGWIDTSAGEAPHAIRPGDFVYISGWATIPGENRLPKFVGITANDARLLISAAWVGTVPRPDVAAVLKDSRYAKSGWGVQIPAKFLPAGESTLKAWAYDDQTQEFVQLSGDKRVVRSAD
jgi:hypothetical protein